MFSSKTLPVLFTLAFVLASDPASAYPRRREPSPTGRSVPTPTRSEVHEYERYGGRLIHRYTLPDGRRSVTTSTIGGRNHGSSTTIIYDRDRRITESSVVS